MSQYRKILVRSPKDYYSLWQLLWRGAVVVYGIPIALYGGLLLIFGPGESHGGHSFVPTQREIFFLLAALVYAIAFLLFPARMWKRVSNLPIITGWGAIIGLGAFALAIIILGEAPTHDTVFVFLCVAAGHGLAAATVWFLERVWLFVRGVRIVQQDGSMCPQCAYDLTGNDSMVCPECGRGFTFADLGTTEEYFRIASAIRLRQTDAI
jgi:hypothetical protein